MTRFTASFRQQLALLALLWLLAGSLAAVTTVLPVHTAALGWTPGFWLLAAPLVILAGLRRRSRQGQGLHFAH